MQSDEIVAIFLVATICAGTCFGAVVWIVGARREREAREACACATILNISSATKSSPSYPPTYVRCRCRVICLGAY